MSAGQDAYEARKAERKSQELEAQMGSTILEAVHAFVTGKARLQIRHEVRLPNTGEPVTEIRFVQTD